MKEIDYEYILKGLKQELSYEEIALLNGLNAPKGNYYDSTLLLNGLLNFYKKKINKEYFKVWCNLVLTALNLNSAIDCRTKSGKIFYEIWDLFDSILFQIDDEAIEKWFSETFSEIKYYCYLYDRSINNDKNLKFINGNLEYYLSFDHYNQTEDTSVYKVLIINNSNKHFTQKYIDNPIFNLETNYNFLEEKDYETKFMKMFDDKHIEDNTILF